MTDFGTQGFGWGRPYTFLDACCITDQVVRFFFSFAFSSANIIVTVWRMRFEGGGDERSGGQAETGSTSTGAQEEWPLRQTLICLWDKPVWMNTYYPQATVIVVFFVFLPALRTIYKLLFLMQLIYFIIYNTWHARWRRMTGKHTSRKRQLATAFGSKAGFFETPNLCFYFFYFRVSLAHLVNSGFLIVLFPVKYCIV